MITNSNVLYVISAMFVHTIYRHHLCSYVLQQASNGATTSQPADDKRAEEIKELTARNNDLSATIELKQTENAELQERIQQLQQSETSPVDGDGGLVEKNSELQLELENIREQLQQTQEENEQFLDTIQDYERQLKDKEKLDDAITELNEDNDVLVQEIKDLQKDLDELSSAKDKVSSDSKRLQEQVQNLEKEKIELEQENKVLLKLKSQRRSPNSGDDGDNDVTQLASGDDRVKDLTAKNESLLTELTEARLKLNDAATSRQSLEEKLSAVNHELADAKTQNAELCAQVTSAPPHVIMLRHDLSPYRYERYMFGIAHLFKSFVYTYRRQYMYVTYKRHRVVFLLSWKSLPPSWTL